MKIIFSPSKTISKNLKTFNTKVKFLEKTEFILEKIPNVKISNELCEAFFMYDGLSFRNIGREDFDYDDLEYIKNNLYIISALYGAINPFDLVYPYRLDFIMKTNMDNLYSFWKEDIANKVLENQDFIVNIASDEFSKTVKKYSKIPFIDFEFYENNNGKLKKHSTISKKARGKMLRFLTKNKVNNIEEIKKFDLDNYKFNEELSTESKFIFVKNI